MRTIKVSPETICIELHQIQGGNVSDSDPTLYPDASTETRLTGVEPKVAPRVRRILIRLEFYDLAAWRLSYKNCQTFQLFVRSLPLPIVNYTLYWGSVRLLVRRVKWPI